MEEGDQTTSDYEKEEGIRQNLKALLEWVIPLAIVNFLIIASAIIILASASWVGAVLFQIPAKDSLATYTPPMILLSLGLTLTGTFLSHKFSTNRQPRYKPRPVKTPIAPIITTQFAHTLVPGGKEAEDRYPRTIPEAPRASTVASETPKSHFEDMGEAPLSSWSVGKWGARHDFKPLSGPPDKLQPRIDAFSFNCQECNRTLILPWEKVKSSIGSNQLLVDCLHCHNRYPFDYERAQRKTLSITFHGIIRKEDQPNDNETPIPAPEPEPTIKNFGRTKPEIQPSILPPNTDFPAAGAMAPVASTVLSHPSAQGLLNGSSENRVGEAARAIRDSSRALVGSLVNNRLFQTMASRLQTNTMGISETPSPGQFTHVLVPGGKEGESISQIIPAVPNKWSPANDADEIDPLHGTFEDMSKRTKPTVQHEQSTLPPSEISQMVPPDRLDVNIENFLFNCQDCDKPIGLPWAKVEAGVTTLPFPVDCPNCHHQFPFNYELAKRKTLTLRFKASLEVPLPQASPDLSREPVATKAPSSPVQQTSAIAAVPRNAIMVLPKNAIVAVRKFAIVAMPKRASKESKTADQASQASRYSPGLAYDRAILERG